MPRQARKRSSTGIYHIMLRGVNRDNIFVDDSDRQRFIEIIIKYKLAGKYLLYGYCLMTNHIHLLIHEKEEPISNYIKRISSSYVYWFNQKYKRVGHLFQERFKSEAIETEEYFITVLRYIHQNPLKGGIVNDMGNYRWSSYNEYIGRAIVTDVEYALDIYGTDRLKATELFDKYSKERNSDECLECIEKVSISDQEILDEIKKHGINEPNQLHKLDKEKRNEIIKNMKKIEGVSIRKLSKLLGVSKSVVERI